MDRDAGAIMDRDAGAKATARIKKISNICIRSNNTRQQHMKQQHTQLQPPQQQHLKQPHQGNIDHSSSTLHGIKTEAISPTATPSTPMTPWRQHEQQQHGY